MGVEHYENFPVASFLMPARLRAPISTLYRFARGADDVADEGTADAPERLAMLARYREQLLQVAAGRPAEPQPDGEMFDALGAVIARFGLPVRLFEDLLDAFAQDVVQTRYDDFAQVLDYCRRSANPVGRLLLALYGIGDAVSLRRSDAICTALQLINFWQDVAVDWSKDRIYLPADSLARFGVGESAIAQARCDDSFRDLMRFETGRARAMMLDGAPLALALPGRIGWELRLVVQGGLRILDKIAAADFDVFRARPILGPVDWLRMLWRAGRMRPAAPVQ